MEHQIISIGPRPVTAENLHSKNGRVNDYSRIIQKYTNEYKVDSYYIHVGTPVVNQGWILHITVVQSQVEDLLDLLVPYILKHKYPFKVIKNMALASDTNGGKLGYYKIGKIITVYLDNEPGVAPLLEELIPLTRNFLGPQVFTDFKLDNVLYIRYGSFIPYIARDIFGNKVSIIRSSDGQMVIDQYRATPFIPFEVSNPFDSLLDKLQQPTEATSIGKKYFTVKLLKSDIKGNVWKGIYFSKYLIPRWCVIKQGRKGMFLDDAGRDARDRIVWQYSVNKKLEKYIPIAKMIDHFEDEGEAYIVIEYIKGGEDIVKSIFTKLNNLPWYLQNEKTKIDIVGSILAVVSAIQIIHEKGYIHRDITGTNFLLTKGGKIKLIDLELIYSEKEKLPNPPFGVGTPGFMSPEQESRGIPSPKDDSYSIGSLMIFTIGGGILPDYIIEEDYNNIRVKLNFLIRDSFIEDLIMECLDPDPDKRPTVKSIYERLTYYKGVNHQQKYSSIHLQSGHDHLKECIQNVFNYIAGKKITLDGLWYSHIENAGGPEIYPVKKKTVFAGIHRGVGGVIWAMAQLKKAGLNVDDVAENVTLGLNFIEKEILPDLEILDPSFFYGKAGIAVMYSSAMSAGFIKDTQYYRDLILSCFNRDAQSLDVIHGIAGQAIAALKCSKYIPSATLKSLLNHYVEVIVNAQNNDGSWNWASYDKKKQEKKTGFGYGIAGVCYFLFIYGQFYKNDTAIIHGEKGLKYLISQAKRKGTGYEWRNSDKDKRICTWWCNGSPGIILSFLKAYEITRKEIYLRIVNGSLRSIPQNLIYQDLSQCHGLSGLGEIYIKAYQITQESEWLDRASWLGALIMTLRIKHNDTQDYWMVEKQDFPTADLMIGNSGVLLFMQRLYVLNNPSFNMDTIY